MNEDIFHTMSIAQQRYHMAYADALRIQETSRNGTDIKAAWDIVLDKEYLFKVAFDRYVQDLLAMDKEFR